MFYYNFKYHKPAEDTTILYYLISSMGIGMPALAILIFYKFKPSIPDKFLLKQNNFLELNKYLNQSLIQFNYQEFYNHEDLVIYKREIKSNIYYIINVKIKELEESNFQKLYEKIIFPKIESDYNLIKKNPTFKLYVTLIICVDKITPTFNKLLNNIMQERGYFKLFVGISFGGNKIYIPKEEIEGFGIPQFTKLKKEFMQIMNLTNNDIIINIEKPILEEKTIKPKIANKKSIKIGKKNLINIFKKIISLAFFLIGMILVDCYHDEKLLFYLFSALILIAFAFLFSPRFNAYATKKFKLFPKIKKYIIIVLIILEVACLLYLPI